MIGRPRANVSLIDARLIGESARFARLLRRRDRGLIAMRAQPRYVDVNVNLAGSRSWMPRRTCACAGPAAAVASREIAVPADDGTELAATLFEPGTAAATRCADRRHRRRRRR